MGLGTFASTGETVATNQFTSMDDALTKATADEATPADMLAFQMEAAMFGITMSCLSNGLKSLTDGMKQPADNARG